MSRAKICIYFQTKCHKGDFETWISYAAVESSERLDEGMILMRKQQNCAFCCRSHAEANMCQCYEIYDRASLDKCKRLSGF